MKAMNPEKLTKHLLHLYNSSIHLRERGVLLDAINYIKKSERDKEAQQEAFNKAYESRYRPDYNEDQ